MNSSAGDSEAGKGPAAFPPEAPLSAGLADLPKTDWAFIRRNAWRWRGGSRWERNWTPLMVFVAQSNASGAPRLFGLFLTLAADAVYHGISGPLLRLGMKGPHLGLDAHPLSLTRLAWRASGVTNEFRWWLSARAHRFARYNS